MVKNILLVALGGAVGSACRYLVTRVVDITAFPIATLAVNLLGCLLVGFLVGIMDRNFMPQEFKLLLISGFCGGFTTFSTFANESFAMMKAGDLLLSGLYIGVSVIFGILAVWFGLQLAK
ncbi:MAG: fluoride efflux transporter CrcB [Bacteroidales bacterium]|nr:fluoride efflux transporter CrcB [Bacteroidales bacterium]MDY6000894.1 fluoride efflux transporter CrcB [Candidatus Cryptobacteroides sp.]